MKKFRKVLSLGLFCLLLTLSMTGCGTGSKDRETGTETEIIDFSALSNDADYHTSQQVDTGIQNEPATESDNLSEQSIGEISGNPANESTDTSAENGEIISADSTDNETATASGNQILSEDEDTFCYESSLGYEIRLPLSWEETVQIVETEEGTVFILTAAEEENYTGILFLIRPLALDALEDYEGIAYAEDFAVSVGEGYQVLRPVDECYDKDNAFVAENFEEKYNEIADIIMTMQAF